MSYVSHFLWLHVTKDQDKELRFTINGWWQNLTQKEQNSVAVILIKTQHSVKSWVLQWLAEAALHAYTGLTHSLLWAPHEKKKHWTATSVHADEKHKQRNAKSRSISSVHAAGTLLPWSAVRLRQSGDQEANSLRLEESWSKQSPQLKSAKPSLLGWRLAHTWQQFGAIWSWLRPKVKRLMGYLKPHSYFSSDLTYVEALMLVAELLKTQSAQRATVNKQI